MKSYTFVDADAHVEECDDTWEYIEPKYRPRRPVVITLDDAPGRGGLNAFWLIDGKTLPQPVGSGASIFVVPTADLGRKKAYTRESQELRDVNARLRDMDTLGIDVQVVFSTIFIFPTTDDPWFEAALYRSYNTWIAGVCAQAADRLKWNAMVPLRLPDQAVKEIERVKALGAVGALAYGTAGEKLLNDASLDPVYAALCDTDLPLCIHVGASCPALNRMCNEFSVTEIIGTPTPLFMAVYCMLGGGILDRFPGLRVGFFEAGSQWIPYMVDRMDHFYEVHRKQGLSIPGVLPMKEPSKYLEDDNLYVTCESNDRLLPTVLQMWGEDRVMVASDMPHSELRDTAKQEIRERSDLTGSMKRKLLVDNALRFYRLRDLDS